MPHSLGTFKKYRKLVFRFASDRRKTWVSHPNSLFAPGTTQIREVKATPCLDPVVPVPRKRPRWRRQHLRFQHSWCPHPCCTRESLQHGEDQEGAETGSGAGPSVGQVEASTWTRICFVR